MNPKHKDSKSISAKQIHLSGNRHFLNHWPKNPYNLQPSNFKDTNLSGFPWLSRSSAGFTWDPLPLTIGRESPNLSRPECWIQTNLVLDSRESQSFSRSEYWIQMSPLAFHDRGAGFTWIPWPITMGVLNWHEFPDVL